MSGIDYIELVIRRVESHNTMILVLLAWNCLLTAGVIIALTKVKDRR